MFLPFIKNFSNDFFEHFLTSSRHDDFTLKKNVQ